MTDRQIIDRAIELLKAGSLASMLPLRLMDEYNISMKKAHRLAGAAVKEWRR